MTIPGTGHLHERKEARRFFSPIHRTPLPLSSPRPSIDHVPPLTVRGGNAYTGHVVESTRYSLEQRGVCNKEKEGWEGPTRKGFHLSKKKTLTPSPDQI